MANSSPSYRHQVFELPKPTLDITEYQLFHGRCQQCNTVSKGALPEEAYPMVRWGHDAQLR
ncbi:transposase, partial [Shewanella benthica KT99]